MLVRSLYNIRNGKEKLPQQINNLVYDFQSLHQNCFVTKELLKHFCTENTEIQFSWRHQKKKESKMVQLTTEVQ